MIEHAVEHITEHAIEKAIEQAIEQAIRHAHLILISDFINKNVERQESTGLQS